MLMSAFFHPESGEVTSDVSRCRTWSFMAGDR